MREEIYQKIKNGIWPENVELVSSSTKGDVYKICTPEGPMFVRINMRTKKVSWIS